MIKDTDKLHLSNRETLQFEKKGKTFEQFTKSTWMST